MNYALKASALALTLSLAATASPAWADFWSDAGAKFKGVTLHGVTESTPPSNYIKDVLAPEFTEDRHQRRVRDDVLGPDVRQGDQGHGGQHRHL